MAAFDAAHMYTPVLQVLNALVGRRRPGLIRSLAAARMPLDLFSTGWMLSLFVADLPLECTFRVWDILFLLDSEEGGASVLTAASLAILSTLGATHGRRTPMSARCAPDALPMSSRCALSEALRLLTDGRTGAHPSLMSPDVP